MEISKRAGMGVTELFSILVMLTAAAFLFYYYVDKRTAESRRTLTVQHMQAVQVALEKYLIDCGGTLPTQKQGLAALLRRPQASPVPRGWRGPYLADAAGLCDGWGRPIKYFCPGGPVGDDKERKRLRPYDLASYGRDGQEGGQGLDRDIYSWDRATMAP